MFVLIGFCFSLTISKMMEEFICYMMEYLSSFCFFDEISHLYFGIYFLMNVVGYNMFYGHYFGSYTLNLNLNLVWIMAGFYNLIIIYFLRNLICSWLMWYFSKIVFERLSYFCVNNFVIILMIDDDWETNATEYKKIVNGMSTQLSVIMLGVKTVSIVVYVEFLNY